MKKIIISFSFLAIAPTMCSEKNWLQQKVDAFAKKMVTRHTYEYNSLEHYRDRAILCILPTKVSQIILKQQRRNMVTFLEENEKNALEGIKKDFNIDNQEWPSIMDIIDKEVAFNQQAMRRKWNYKTTTHDPSLPEAWVNALKRECARHGILPENLNFDVTTNPDAFGTSLTNQPCLSADTPVENTYFPASVWLNLEHAQEVPQRLNKSAAHELVHIIKNHCLYDMILWNEIYKPKGVEITEHPLYHNLCAAQEKTADTLVACTDAEYAHDYADLVIKRLVGYPDNHNDMQVLHANWQLSEILTNSQQLKSSIAQKLNVFPKSVV